MADDIVSIKTQDELEMLRKTFESKWAQKFKEVDDAHRALRTKYNIAINRVTELEETLKDVGTIIDSVLKPREE
jgi:hypothetical protein